ncbi:hypothetical protein V1514DRAFT_287300 [Lipomyces japonicus]|uniref:uncharacterized protein n=1 Tax=Lipomyces japonicus TaxID=56871 RepID=UPI0034D00029
MVFSLDSLKPYEAKPTILVTGGTSGIGKIAVREFIRLGARVYVLARNPTKSAALVADIANELNYDKQDVDIHIIEADFFDLKSVVSAAEKFKSNEQKLDILLNNAGTMIPSYAETSDDYESTLQINYVAPYLLTRLLLPNLLAAPAPRVINVSSLGHTFSSGFWYNDSNFKSAWGFDIITRSRRYGQSKLALILFTKSFAKLYPTIISVAVHPGAIFDTGLYDNFNESTYFFGKAKYVLQFMRRQASWLGGISLEDGALTSIFCAASPHVTLADNGEYYVPIAKKGKPSSKVNEPAADELYKWTEAQLIEKGYLHVE